MCVSNGLSVCLSVCVCVLYRSVGSKLVSIKCLYFSIKIISLLVDIKHKYCGETLNDESGETSVNTSSCLTTANTRDEHSRLHLQTVWSV